jgi:hypothetical protein
MVNDSVPRSALDREMELLRPEVRADRQRLEALLDDDFVEIGATGRIWTRDELIAELFASPALDDLDVSDVAVRTVAPDVVLVTYTTSRADIRVRRSAWWRSSGTGWRCIFHQGTRIASP